MDGTAVAREYYRAIDEGDWDAFDNLLAPDFVQVRSDRTLDGRNAFVSFMRDERPETDTEHVVDAIFTRDGGVAVEGRLLRASGKEWFAFVDVFDVVDGSEGDVRFDQLRTYTR